MSPERRAGDAETWRVRKEGEGGGGEGRVQLSADLSRRNTQGAKRRVAKAAGTAAKPG